MDGGQWTPASRARYNLRDTVARCTTQVWTKQPFGFVIFLFDLNMFSVKAVDAFVVFAKYFD